jgi:tripartite-type tricarboxylate transporter receptor subunit TctC
MKYLLKILLLLAAGGALAQPYPNKPIRVLVAFPPGGPVDIIARLIGPKISDAFGGQSVVVENVGGGGGNIAALRVVKSPSDGYTLLAHSSAYAVNPALLGDPGFNAEKDMIPIAVVARQPNLILVNADFPARTLSELFEQSKKQKLAYASPSSGTTPHLTAENLFKVRAKVDITHVPFKGAGPAVAGLLGGQPPIGSLAGSAPMPHIRAGKLRALAVSSDVRLGALPDVPTLNELGYTGMEDYTWVGLFAPAGTPAEIVQRLNDAVLKGVQDPDMQARFESLAFQATARPLRETSDYIKSELVKWAKVVKDTGAKPD